MKPSSKYAIALTAALGLIMAVLDNTIVNVALFPMATGLNASLSAIQWVITGYFLAQAAVIPVAGYLSNLVGIKRLFIICLALFTASSLLCGMAQDATTLIVFRIIQGLGGGALFPLAQAIAFGAFPSEERAAASAVVSIPVLLAPAFGPTLGGFLTVRFGWEYIFLINVPIGILAVLLAWRTLPADKQPSNQARGGFDYVGLALVTLGVLAVVFAFTLVSEPRPGTITALNPQGELYGWGYWLVWVILATGVLTLAAFAVYELRFRSDPVLDLRLFERYDYTIGSAVIWCNAIIVFGSLFCCRCFCSRCASRRSMRWTSGWR
ncbi:MAG: DHA2 family efflux MFS transporter permease subunit [Blastochloris sp.]|nr:DHA2 family efflux MFS transporter permease subunit [Blastochloris sp.]